MKCIKCGQEMYLVTSGGSDTVCGNYLKTKYVCPKCGAVLSPSTKECPYCTPYKVTCGPSSGFPVTTGFSSGVTSQAQNSVTATSSSDLQVKEKENESSND